MCCFNTCSLSKQNKRVLWHFFYLGGVGNDCDVQHHDVIVLKSNGVEQNIAKRNDKVFKETARQAVTGQSFGSCRLHRHIKEAMSK